jgi:hypothetical protein
MSSKVQTAVRLNKDLLDALKEKTKADNRSLNNYIEKLLYRDVGNIPNETTKAAIKEAQNSNDLERIDDVDIFFDKL